MPDRQILVPVRACVPHLGQVPPDPTPEHRRAAMRRGPLFRLRTAIDTSQLLCNGMLIRSTRLARLEAALILAGSASAARLSRLARLVDTNEVHQLIARLNQSYDRTKSAFRAERTAAGYQLLTRPALAGWLDRLHHRQTRMKLSQPALETLTIIAYRQPVTRADVESIRGVQSSDLIRQLIDRGLICVAGEDNSLGRPFLYETTRTFLDMFGLGRLQDLPDHETLRQQADNSGAAEEPAQSESRVTGDPAESEVMEMQDHNSDDFAEAA